MRENFILYCLGVMTQFFTQGKLSPLGEGREGTRGFFSSGNFQINFDFLLYLNNMIKIVKQIV